MLRVASLGPFRVRTLPILYLHAESRGDAGQQHRIRPLNERGPRRPVIRLWRPQRSSAPASAQTGSSRSRCCVAAPDITAVRGRPYSLLGFAVRCIHATDAQERETARLLPVTGGSCQTLVL